MNQKILIIEDDEELRKLLQVQLEKRDYRVFAARSGREGLRRAFQIHPDLVTLDIMMPDMDGWEVCRRLRELSSVPIIMLTACGMQEEIVKGLEHGADDYITKPFSNSELQARISAVLRRSNGNGQNGKAKSAAYFNGNLSIDFDRRIVKVRDEQVNLTPTEFKLLSCLVRNEGRVLPHRYILTQVWGVEYADEVDYVKLYIRYLRRKIEDDPANPFYIQTEWGVGYYFSKS